MGSGFSKMKKQASALKQQFEKMQNDLKTTLVTGSAGAGLVTVTINGDKEIQNIQIKPDCVNRDDIEGLQDLIKAAFEEAYRQLPNSDPMGFSLPFNI